MTTELTLDAIMAMMAARQDLAVAKTLLRHSSAIETAERSGQDNLFTELENVLPGYIRLGGLLTAAHVNAEHLATLAAAWKAFAAYYMDGEAMTPPAYEAAHGKTHPREKLGYAVEACYDDAHKIYLDYRLASFLEVSLA